MSQIELNQSAADISYILCQNLGDMVNKNLLLTSHLKITGFTCIRRVCVPEICSLTFYRHLKL